MGRQEVKHGGEHRFTLRNLTDTYFRNLLQEHQLAIIEVGFNGV
jgi:hypothetical protein